MTPAGAKLDRFLTGAIKDLSGAKGDVMPEVGGKKLAGEFSTMMAGIRKMVDDRKIAIAAAVTELTVELKSGEEVERALRAEAAEVRRAFADVLGNNPPSDENGEQK